MHIHSRSEMSISPPSIPICATFPAIATNRNFSPLGGHRTLHSKSHTLRTSHDTLRSKRHEIVPQAVVNLGSLNDCRLAASFTTTHRESCSVALKEALVRLYGKLEFESQPKEFSLLLQCTFLLPQLMHLQCKNGT